MLTQKMLDRDKAHMLIGAVLGALAMFIYQSVTAPTEEEIIQEAWQSIAYYDNSIEAAGTGNLMSVRDRIDFELACRPNRGEFEDALAMVRRSLPQNLPWCLDPEQSLLFDPALVERARRGR